jgi:hypothetical protein
MHYWGVIIQLMSVDPEKFFNVWEMILSRQPEIIKKIFDSLDDEEKNSVMDHLLKMKSGSGWQPGQRESARTALDAILNTGHNKSN